MRVHVFKGRGLKSCRTHDDAAIRRTLRVIAAGSDTRELTVVVYLLNRKSFWEAHAYTDHVTPAVFQHTGPSWNFVKRFGPPPGLRPRFRLIRMAFGMQQTFPRWVTDVYGWKLRCESFLNLLAYTFGHELHHYRRYVLGLHPGQGEQAACRWAIQMANQTGYGLEAIRVKIDPATVPRCAEALRRKKWISALCVKHKDHFELLRSLPDGAPLIITHDSGKSRHVGMPAFKIRNLKKGSYRMSVRTPDGKEWFWPMQWLLPATLREVTAAPVKKSRERTGFLFAVK